MSAGLYPKNDRAFQRAVEVQRLVIPFVITANATPSSKALSNDEPSVLFLQTQGASQVSVTSGALDSGESVPPFDLSAADSSGDFNMLVNVREDKVLKIMQAQVINRVTGAAYATYHNSSNPDIVGAGLNQMCLNCHTGVNLASTSLDACLAIEYITQE